MKIIINDICETLPQGSTVADLVAVRGLADKGGVAVAINGKIVKKPDWESRILCDLDNILIINAAYGG